MAEPGTAVATDASARHPQAPIRGPRKSNVALAVAFAGVLLAPTAAVLARWEPFRAMDEKRALAPRPTLDLRRLRPGQIPALAQAWERHFADHFGLRKLLIGSYRLGLFHLFRISQNPAVVIGRADGQRRWLYFDPVGDGSMGFEGFLGRRPYTPAQLGLLAAQLRQIRAATGAVGAKLVIAVAPDKQTIYPEYLPRARQPRAGAVSRLAQFWAMAPWLAGVPLVDLREPLRRAKAEHQLYYPSDTHWNWRAGMLAYQAIARALVTQDPSFVPLPVERMGWWLGPPRVGDLSTLMGLPPLGGDRDWLPALHELAPPAKRGKLLVLADSFFELVLPFLKLHFEEIEHIYFGPGAREQLLAPGFLAERKPDVVIVGSLERFWTTD